MKLKAIIAARGGSKRVPGKNIKLLKNKPLIVYPITEAKKCKYISEVYVSTDDAEIKKMVDEGYNKAKKILTEKIDDLHKLAKALLIYETLTGSEIEDLIYKNIYPANKEDLKVEGNDQDSALGSIGLKPKIVH